EEVLAQAHAQKDWGCVAEAVLSLAGIAAEMEEPDAAWSYGLEARQRMAALGDRIGLVRPLEVLCGVAVGRGDLETARSLMEERLALCRELGASDYLIHALGALAHRVRDDGDYARARALYQESLILRRQLEDQFSLAQALEDLAVLAGREEQ